MEKFEQGTEFGDMVKANLLPVFENVRSEFREKIPADSLAQGLLEIAEAIIFDENERKFYQIYTNVPSHPGGPGRTVCFAMLPQEVGLLTEQMRKMLSSQEN